MVTRVKVPTIKITTVYGGAISHSLEQMQALFAALENLSYGAGDDIHTQGYLSFGWVEK